MLDEGGKIRCTKSCASDPPSLRDEPPPYLTLYWDSKCSAVCLRRESWAWRMFSVFACERTRSRCSLLSLKMSLRSPSRLSSASSLVLSLSGVASPVAIGRSVSHCIFSRKFDRSTRPRVNAQKIYCNKNYMGTTAWRSTSLALCLTAFPTFRSLQSLPETDALDAPLEQSDRDRQSLWAAVYNRDFGGFMRALAVVIGASNAYAFLRDPVVTEFFFSDNTVAMTTFLAKMWAFLYKYAPRALALTFVGKLAP